MSHLPLASLLALASEGTQGVNNISVLIAAFAGLLGAVIGGTVTIVVARISAHAENERQERRLKAEVSSLEQAHLGELERQIREAAVGLSDSWANIIRAHDHYRNMATMSPADADKVRTQMVKALTHTGSQLNALLVLPINEALEAQVFVIDEAVDLFRRSINDTMQSLKYRNAVSPAILKLFGLLREGRLIRAANNTR